MPVRRLPSSAPGTGSLVSFERACPHVFHHPSVPPDRPTCGRSSAFHPPRASPPRSPAARRPRRAGPPEVAPLKTCPRVGAGAERQATNLHMARGRRPLNRQPPPLHSLLAKRLHHPFSRSHSKFAFPDFPPPRRLLPLSHIIDNLLDLCYPLSHAKDERPPESTTGSPRSGAERAHTAQQFGAPLRIAAP